MSSERRVGLPLPSQVKAADMLQKRWDTAGNQPLPQPYAPGVATPESVGIDDVGDGITLLFIGDHGGIEDPNPQKAVVAAMQAELQPHPAIKAVVSVGDIVYFNGDPGQFMPQFYQPYAHLPLPIVGVPGNHDGDPTDGVPGAGIATFMANFCAPTPARPACDPEDEFGRDTQTQPSHDWTLKLKATTLIGLWSNVASGGHLGPEQISFLQAQLEGADPSLPLIVYMHHPCYSVDAFHGGSALMGETLDAAFTAANRWPTAVIAGHIHDYQRFTRQRPGGRTTYIVIGNSGYHNLHALAGDVQNGMDLGNGVTLNYADAVQWGYLALTFGQGRISGAYMKVPLQGPPSLGEAFSL